MKQHTDYSDEHISAYIDGEFDYEERARLLYDEQNDEVLARRINEARILKEKVQLAYSEITDPKLSKRLINCTSFISQNKTLVASFLITCAFVASLFHNVSTVGDLNTAKQLIASTQPITADKIIDAVVSDKQIVIHLSQYEQSSFGDTLEQIELLLEQHKSDTAFNIEIVASMQGLKALDTTSSIYAERISLLAERFDGLEVVACAKSLTALAAEDNPVSLLKSIIMTPSATQQIAKRSKQGWSYIKI
jgi:intracellular sulfur oxidation DsrE/DsrF family protein